MEEEMEEEEEEEEVRPPSSQASGWCRLAPLRSQPFPSRYWQLQQTIAIYKSVHLSASAIRGKI